MSDLKCVKCREYLSSPIFICSGSTNEASNDSNTTHLTCGKCVNSENQTKEILKRCNVCNGLLQRSQIFEKLYSQTKHSCIYEDEGCTFALSIDKKHDHETNECLYRPIKCSNEMNKFLNHWVCDWVGKLNEFYKHFQEKHPDNVYKYASDKNEQKIQIKFSEKVQTCLLISAHFNLFWLKHQMNTDDTRKAYWAIQFIGTKNKASRYYYEFEIYKATDPIRKYKITEYCESDSLSHKTIFYSGKCVAISFNTLISFITNGEILTRFRICKIKPNDNTKSDESAKKTVNKPINNKEKIKKEKKIEKSIENVDRFIGSSPINPFLPPLNLPPLSRTGNSQESQINKPKYKYTSRSVKGKKV